LNPDSTGPKHISWPVLVPEFDILNAGTGPNHQFRGLRHRKDDTYAIARQHEQEGRRRNKVDRYQDVVGSLASLAEIPIAEILTCLLRAMQPEEEVPEGMTKISRGCFANAG
jgi:hypothetical protein